jgi:hypothetical protein
MTPDRFTAVVNHGAVDSTVDPAIIDGQLASARALRRRLDENGGVILGDEVGAGKTYVTFALLAEALAANPDRGAAIFVPTALLKEKWCRQLREYFLAAMIDSELGHELAERITPIDKGLRDDGSFGGEWGKRAARDAIVVATHNVYSHQTSEADKAASLRAAARTFDVGRAVRPSGLLRACGVDPHKGWIRWAHDDVLNSMTLAPLRPIVQRYSEGERGLWVSDAVQAVRLNVGRKLLPDSALVIVDEAHNLKSTHSANYRALMGVLSSRFDALLFLTATPFQLGRDELLNIVAFFSHSRAYEGREEAFVAKVDAMRLGMAGWVEALDRFGRAWKDLDIGQAATCRQIIAGGEAGPTSGAPEQAAALFSRCMTAKLALEAGLRPFLLRTVRERNHKEHPGVPAELITDDTRIPLALVDRLITELLASQRRTFISSALISACSSWDALAAAAITGEREDDGLDLHTRSVLRKMIGQDAVGEHPKVARTLAVCREGLDRGDKTLVFVERQQTGRHLRDSLELEFDSEPADTAALARLQDRSRFGWPSLRENYLHTIYPFLFGDAPVAEDVDRAWELAWVQELWGRVDPEGEKRDFVIEKRFWEHVLFRLAAERRSGWASGHGEALRSCGEHLLEQDYVLNGLDLTSGESNQRLAVPDNAQRAVGRLPRLPFAHAFVGYASPWGVGAQQLACLPPVLRSRFVDEAAGAFARSHFRRELAALEVEADAGAHFNAVSSILLDSGSTWPTRFAALCDQAKEAVSTPDAELRGIRIDAMIEALKSNTRIQFIDGSTKTPTQLKAVRGFNTPLYPEVIIATPVLAEGLDLHRFCRRIIHHDLPWNPAKLEQRTGRVDRVGSLAERLSAGGTGVPIDVWLPYVAGTYDEFVFERVMARRREFRCVLGNRPEWQGDGELGDDERGTPMDDELAGELQARLGPDLASKQTEGPR